MTCMHKYIDVNNESNINIGALTEIPHQRDVFVFGFAHVFKLIRLFFNMLAFLALG